MPSASTGLATLFFGASLMAAGPHAWAEPPQIAARRAFIRGQQAFKLGKLATAEKEFRKALELDGADLGALRNLGLVQAKGERCQEAVATLTRYLSQHAGAADRASVRRVLDGCKHRIQEAQASPEALPATHDLRLPPALKPGSEAARKEARKRYDRGRVLNNNSREELDHYRAAVALDPNHGPSLYNLGILYLARGKPRLAVAAHRRYAALTPHAHEGYYLLGVDLQASGDLAGAVEAYRAALDRYSKHFDSRNNLAVALEKQGHHKEAIEEYKRAIELAPPGADVRARYNLADLFLKRRELDHAEREFESVLAARHRPQESSMLGAYRPVPLRLFAAAHHSLGKINEARQLNAEAVAEYTAALTLLPSFEPARKALLRLRQPAERP